MTQLANQYSERDGTVLCIETNLAEEAAQRHYL
jgi:hypothetical protein